jgi:hypothetical protein
MKVLISDYVSHTSSEPLYINTILNTIGCQSTIWPRNTSTYDIFDLLKPDLHITHHSKLTKDLALYLKENSVDIIINITGMNQESLSQLDSVLSEYQVNPVFYFINYHHHGLKSRTNIVPILHGADILLGQTPKQYNINLGVFIDNKSQIEQYDDTYHYLTTNEKLIEDADIFLPVYKCNSLYVNYNHIVFKYFNNIFPQAFFDAAIYNGNVVFDVDNRSNLDEQLSKLLGETDKCIINDLASGNIKENILKKHTCLHRVKSLLSQLSCKDIIDTLQELIERSIQQ